MHPIQIVSTGGLVAVFVLLCVLAWRHSRGHSLMRPFLERAAIAACLLPVGWMAFTWLRAGHPEATTTRVVAVWLQLLMTVGSATLLVFAGWLRPRSRGARQRTLERFSHVRRGRSSDRPWPT